MNARVVSLLLAAGLLVLAVWFALQPVTRPLVPGRQEAPTSVAKPVALASPTVAPGRLPPSSPVAGISPANPTVAPALGAGLPAHPSPANALAGTAVDSNSIDSAGGILVRAAQINAVKVRVMLKDFHTLMGENPVGTNAEIMQTLMGENPRQAKLGPPAGMSLNGSGELVDPWEIPYFFHQLSKDVMEIRSAGPDKVLWTNDDIVVR